MSTVEDAQPSAADVAVNSAASNRAEARYYRLFSRLGAMVFELAPDGRILSINDAVQKATGYHPADLQSAYNLPSASQGNGQTVAIVDAYDDPNAEADLGVYRSTFGLPACTTGNGCFKKVNQEGQQGN